MFFKTIFSTKNTKLDGFIGLFCMRSTKTNVTPPRKSMMMMIIVVEKYYEFAFVFTQISTKNTLFSHYQKYMPYLKKKKNLNLMGEYLFNFVSN